MKSKVAKDLSTATLTKENIQLETTESERWGWASWIKCHADVMMISTVREPRPILFLLTYDKTIFIKVNILR